MALGVEYRTTERYLGKPVYTKLVDFGAAPNATTKIVNHGVANVDNVISSSFSTVTYDKANLISHPAYQTMVVSPTIILIKTNDNKSDSNIYVAMKYTKTTD